MPSPDKKSDRRRLPPGVIFLLPLLLAGCEADSPPSAGASEASGVLQAITQPVESGTVHQVRMTQHGDRYAFAPSELTVAPGDVVRFVMVGNQPESVVFDTSGLPAPLADYVAGRGLDRGILMTDPGSTFDVSFEDAPAGDYPFRSIPHHEAGMKGLVRVVVSP